MLSSLLHPLLNFTILIFCLPFSIPSLPVTITSSTFPLISFPTSLLLSNLTGYCYSILSCLVRSYLIIPSTPIPSRPILPHSYFTSLDICRSHTSLHKPSSSLSLLAIIPFYYFPTLLTPTPLLQLPLSYYINEPFHFFSSPLLLLSTSSPLHLFTTSPSLHSPPLELTTLLPLHSFTYFPSPPIISTIRTPSNPYCPSIPLLPLPSLPLPRAKIFLQN